MPTHPVGKNTKTIGLKMRLDMAEEIERRARSMRLSTGAYCKIILDLWLKSGKKIQLQEK
jgi:hypothetical protein